MSIEQKTPNGARKAPSRFAEAQKRAERLAAASAGGQQVENPAVEFLKGAWSELKKTTWPTKEVLTKSVSVVLLLVFAVAVWVLIVEKLCTALLTPIFGGSHS